MNITTKFDLADTVYLAADANKGDVIPLIVERIVVEVERVELSVIRYQVHNNAKFQSSEAYESDLMTEAEAEVAATAALEKEKAEIQQRIDAI